VATYAEYAAARERAARKAAQDRHLATLQHRFDVTAGEVRMKYERASFAVVGEGTRSAQENYRAGWSRIFGSRE
jgi:head-tail adaptor